MSKFSKPFSPMVSCVTRISIQVLVIYIRLIKEMSMVVQKIIQSTFPVFAMNLFWRSKTSNRYCSYFICHSPCSINKSLPSGKGFGGFIIAVMKKSFTLGHEITRGSYNLYSGFQLYFKFTCSSRRES